jgi:hypothetical protein
MNSRRKFLLHGSLATAALFVTKPFTSAAKALESTTGFNMQHNHVNLVYAGKYSNQSFSILQNHITKLQSNWSSPVLLQASNDNGYNNTSLKFDATVGSKSSATDTENDYHISTKGNIRTGIIMVAGGERNIVKRVNKLAAFLKNEKNCQVVVCLSSLGYKTRRGLDDCKLAVSSKGVDVILGGHPTNYLSDLVVSRNKAGEEVFIHSASEKNIAFGSIAFEFNDAGQKRSFAFNRVTTSAA